jgi:predicted RNase H-like HicB family nuclease
MKTRTPMPRKRKTTGSERTADILKKPYSRIITPDEAGGYTASVLEFPGCFAEGDTPQEAYKNLEAAAEAWLEAALEQGMSIPAPQQEETASGRMLLRLPRALHARASRQAAHEGVSLNQFVVAAVAERIGTATVTNKVLVRLDALVAAASRSLPPRPWLSEESATFAFLKTARSKAEVLGPLSASLVRFTNAGWAGVAKEGASTTALPTIVDLAADRAGWTPITGE